MKKILTIEEYIKQAPKGAQPKLKRICSIVKQIVPDAKPGIKWGMPAFSYDRILITFAAFKHHVGLYSTPSAISTFAPQLTKYKTAKGSIQFPLDESLPTHLIQSIVKFRVQELLQKDKKWKG